MVERIGRCDYKIFVKGKVKPFHANLLKKYVSRDEAGVVQIPGVARNIFETQAQGLCEMAVVVPYCSCCLCLYFGSSIMLVTYFVNFR